MIPIKILPAALVLFVLSSGVAQAWVRAIYEDAVVVERSELIVVAHLKEGSLQNRGLDHEGTLVITSVLKGKFDDREIRITMHYGLKPVVKSRRIGKNIPAEPRGENEVGRKDIEIADTANLDPPLVTNAQEDNLWFLCKRSGDRGSKIGTGNYGVADREDVQPLKSKEYILCYLSDDPEAAVRAYVSQDPREMKRGERYLDHLEIERILALEDPKMRYDKLLPFFLKRASWNMKWAAEDGIIGCGSIACEPLKEVFENPQHHRLRYSIIQIWRKIGDRRIVPFLIDLLKEHDRFWAEQHLYKDWWSDWKNPETERRQSIYGEAYASVRALRSLGDRQAIEAIELTKKRWSATDFDIVQECDKALREMNVED